MRIEANLTDTAEVQQVEWLQSILGVKKRTRLLRDALALLGWAVREVVAGRRIASISANGAIREFSTTLLERASWMQREAVVFSPEGMEQVAEMIANPPEPSEQLRELMSGAM